MLQGRSEATNLMTEGLITIDNLKLGAFESLVLRVEQGKKMWDFDFGIWVGGQKLDFLKRGKTSIFPLPTSGINHPTFRTKTLRTNSIKIHNDKRNII